VKEPVWIDVPEALAIHDRLLALHGGGSGLRDEGLLKSALARPRQHFACTDAPDVVDMATAYTASIVRNHPFIDGYKRTGFVAGVLFLALNGRRFTASEQDAAQAVLALAAGSFDEAGFAAWLRTNSARRRQGFT
jgi:death-on-curing protein